MPRPTTKSAAAAPGPGRRVGADGTPADRRAAVPPETGWTFLTNHAHVLLCLADDAEARLRDVAERVGITERAVLNIVRDLEEAGIVERTRDGRRNRYAIDGDHPLRHPLEAHRRVAEMLGLLRRPARD